MRSIKLHIRYKTVQSNRHIPLTFTWVKLCKTPEVNSEPAHFVYICKYWYDISNLDNMLLSVSQPAPILEPRKDLGFLETLKNTICYKIILVTS